MRSRMKAMNVDFDEEEVADMFSDVRYVEPQLVSYVCMADMFSDVRY